MTRGPNTPMTRFFARWMPARLVTLAVILVYAFLLFGIGITIGTPPPDLMYIDVRGDQ